VNRFVAALASTSLVASTIALVPSAVAAPGTPPELAPAAIGWEPCQAVNLKKARAECGFLEVPLDYAKPAALALSTLGNYCTCPNHSGDAYDWIGFDPRGVGSSKPRWHATATTSAATGRTLCAAHAAGGEGLAGPFQGLHQGVCQERRAARATSRRPAWPRTWTACPKRWARSRSTTTASRTARTSARCYGTLFTERVRRMVLESNVGPRKVWYQANLDQDVAFDANITAYFDWVATYEAGPDACRRCHRFGRGE
jgi:hypothetical protein